MVYQDIYNILIGVTTNVYHKTIPENYNFSDLLIVFEVKITNVIHFSDDIITTEIYNLKIKIFDKDEQICINTMNTIIPIMIKYQNSTIRKIELNMTDTLYDDLLDVNNIIIDMTITNDLF